VKHSILKTQDKEILISISELKSSFYCACYLSW